MVSSIRERFPARTPSEQSDPATRGAIGLQFTFCCHETTATIEFPSWRGGRVVEGTGLENRQTRKRLEGSKSLPLRQQL